MRRMGVEPARSKLTDVSLPADIIQSSPAMLRRNSEHFLFLTNLWLG